MQYSSKGIPILPLATKLEALTKCATDGSWEDAMGHLFDLMAHLQPYKRFDREQIIDFWLRYGQNPNPILDEEAT